MSAPPPYDNKQYQQPGVYQQQPAQVYQQNVYNPPNNVSASPQVNMSSCDLVVLVITGAFEIVAAFALFFSILFIFNIPYFGYALVCGIATLVQVCVKNKGLGWAVIILQVIMVVISALYAVAVFDLILAAKDCSGTASTNNGNGGFSEQTFTCGDVGTAFMIWFGFQFCLLIAVILSAGGVVVSHFMTLRKPVSGFQQL
eukprot:TRINITY_DN5309_c0_g1_i1.p1 TRINITY_DN5309_c0_g1~~TRINITY_DN5309_c0_g1_i1.p1  ORF type:complete len:225 (+),score=69.74 TRINITY_DN5309_c0_g1_i1:76-675(+)